MYLFSCNATVKRPMQDLSVGEVRPFIVYINFADLFGAEHLCKLYLMQEGFTAIEIEKRKHLAVEQIKPLAEHDKDIQEALATGYQLCMFESH